MLAIGSLQTERELLDHPHDLLPQHITFDNIVSLPLGRQGADIPEQMRSYTLTYAAGLLATLPTLWLALLLQRYVVSGLTAGVVKG